MVMMMKKKKKEEKEKIAAEKRRNVISLTGFLGRFFPQRKLFLRRARR